MDIPSIDNINPPVTPPNIAVLLLLIIGNRDENTTTIINELDPTYKSADVRKLPFKVKLTPFILEKL
jgi:hypothetical protein